MARKAPGQKLWNASAGQTEDRLNRFHLAKVALGNRRMTMEEARQWIGKNGVPCCRVVD